MELISFIFKWLVVLGIIILVATHLFLIPVFILGVFLFVFLNFQGEVKDMSKSSKMALKIVLVALYVSLTGVNLMGLKYHAWTCMENSRTYQIWLTVVVILAYNVICAIYKSFKLWESLQCCKDNMRELKIK